MMKNEKKNATELKEQMNSEFLFMVPEALESLRDLLNDPSINPLARVQAISLILDRGLGKPEESIRIQDVANEEEEARQRMEAVLNRIRNDLKKRGEG